MTRLGTALSLCAILGCGASPSGPEGPPPTDPAAPQQTVAMAAPAEPTEQARQAACDSMTPQDGCYPRRIPVDPCSGAERDPANETEPATQCHCDLCADDSSCTSRAGGRCRQLQSADDVCAPNRRVCAYPDEACYDDDGCEPGTRCLHRDGRAVCAPMPDVPA